MSKSDAHWPAWFSHPTEGRKIFNSHEEVPLGWYSNPEDAAAAADANKVPLEDGPDAWGGYPKAELVSILRKVPDEKVHAGTSARKLFERAVEIGAITVDPPKPEGEGEKTEVENKDGEGEKTEVENKDGEGSPAV